MIRPRLVCICPLAFRNTRPFKSIPAINEIDEPWKDKSDEVKYVPLQPKVGDEAVYLQKSGWEIEFNNEKYVIVPHNAVLMLIRDEGLFK
jgi:chaperonin GroES